MIETIYNVQLPVSQKMAVKGAELLPSEAASLVAIVATTVVMGGLNMKTLVKRKCIGG